MRPTRFHSAIMTAALFSLSLSFAVHAGSAASDEARPKGQDVDEIITNAKMRAQTGSKSKYSISTGASYSGGSLARPFGVTRPNITGGTGSTDFSSASASIGGRYAITTTSALSLGIGGRMITPLLGLALPDGYHGNKFDVDSPALSYQYLYRWLGIQSALGVGENFVTTSDLRKRGYVTSVSVSQNNVYDFKDNGFTIGVSTYINAGYFDRNDPVDKMGQSDYGLGLTPALEYRLSARSSLHLDSNILSFEHLRSTRGNFTFQKDSVTQNFGFGYAVTRDFFVSPGLAFRISNLRLDSTIWSIGCNLNIF